MPFTEIILSNQQLQLLSQSSSLLTQIINSLQPLQYGAAGGDLGGSYPNPTVHKIEGTPLSSLSSASTGQGLVWNGSSWSPGNVSSGVTILSYGADPTGATDIHSALVAAIAALPSGGILIFPAGTYKLATNFAVPENINLTFQQATIVISSGITLTINGTIAAPVQSQIFSYPTASGYVKVTVQPVIIPDASPQPFVTPYWFGAAGNGSTDDYIPLQLAANACSRMYLPPGTFLIAANPLLLNYYIAPNETGAGQLRPSFHMWGDGYTSCIMMFQDASPTWDDYTQGPNDGSTGVGLVVVSGIYNTEIDHIRFEGNTAAPYQTAAQTATLPALILTQGPIYSLNFHHNYIQNGQGQGTYGEDYDVSVQNVFWTDNQVFNWGWNAVYDIYSTQLHTVSLYAPVFQCTAERVVVSRNSFTNIANGISCSGKDMVISDNVFRNFHSFAVAVGDYDDTRNVVIANNQIECDILVNHILYSIQGGSLYWFYNPIFLESTFQSFGSPNGIPPPDGMIVEGNSIRFNGAPEPWQAGYNYYTRRLGTIISNAGSIYQLNSIVPNSTGKSANNSTTVAAGSNTVNVNTFAGAGILHVASTATFPSAGSLEVATGSGAVYINYTGTSGGNEFTGCTTLNSGAGVLSTSGSVISGGPTSTSSGAITDGEITWIYICPIATTANIQGILASDNDALIALNTIHVELNQGSSHTVNAIALLEQVQPITYQVSKNQIEFQGAGINRSNCNGILNQLPGTGNQLLTILSDSNYIVGLATPAQWVTDTVYNDGNTIVLNGGHYYKLYQEGTSSGGPSGTSLLTPVTDGTCEWLYVGDTFSSGGAYNYGNTTPGYNILAYSNNDYRDGGIFAIGSAYAGGSGTPVTTAGDTRASNSNANSWTPPLNFPAIPGTVNGTETILVKDILGGLRNSGLPVGTIYGGFSLTKGCARIALSTITPNAVVKLTHMGSFLGVQGHFGQLLPTAVIANWRT
jgi:hypothetical protein